ncbi:Enoyl reductase LovC 2 [Phlyctema vagabunda]|uniref:Enoyl reductase LovC 2 n=1 Tax=Phlyctema vagabunda TaxID=108571 RepID=A0ABR4P349_9HELO
MPSADPISSLPKGRTIITARGPGQLVIQHNAPMPLLEPNIAIVKTAAVAINPSDAKFLDFSPAPGAIHGTDFAGTIVALGSDVLAAGRFSIGDRVAGLVHGMNKLRPDVGSFAEYIGATIHTMVRLPDSMSFEEGATLGLSTATAAFGLFSELRVPASLDQLRAGGIGIDEQDREFVLVAGGSTATGTRAIQLLKIAGLRPIATCSPSNNELVLRFGAEKVFDYNSSTCAAEIRAYTSNELAYAFDCVAEAGTTELCYAAIGRAGGRYVTVEPFRDSVVKTRELTIEPSWILATSVFGNKIALDGVYGRDARSEDRDFGDRAFAVFQALLDHGGLVDTHPVKSMPGGWEGVMKGVEIIRSQPPSGFKLVYSVL